jgi:uncharacterized protein
MNATRKLLSANKWYFHHGPIDLILQSDGDQKAVDLAFENAWNRFSTLLSELVEELELLKSPVSLSPTEQVPPLSVPLGDTAYSMWRTCHELANCNGYEFITPMASVAGAVADTLIEYFKFPGINRAWVNNGGDIALYLAENQSVDIGTVGESVDLSKEFLIKYLHSSHKQNFFQNCRLLKENITGKFRVHYAMPVRGVATSGLGGRSFTLGIAQSVTVLAQTAVLADAAATLIANAVNLDLPEIIRKPANTIKDDSDLKDKLVTVSVPKLSQSNVELALSFGLSKAITLSESLIKKTGKHIYYVLINLQEKIAIYENSPHNYDDKIANHRGNRLVTDSNFNTSLV